MWLKQDKVGNDHQTTLLASTQSDPIKNGRPNKARKQQRSQHFTWTNAWTQLTLLRNLRASQPVGHSESLLLITVDDSGCERKAESVSVELPQHKGTINAGRWKPLIVFKSQLDDASNTHARACLHMHAHAGCKRSARHLWRLCCNQHADNQVSAPFFLFTFITWERLPSEPELGCVSTGHQTTDRLLSDLIAEKFLLRP